MPISYYPASSSSSSPTEQWRRPFVQAGCLSSAATMHIRSRCLLATPPGSPLYTASASQSPRTSTDAAAPSSPCAGFSVVEEFYRRINLEDFESAAELIAEDCVYEDLVYRKPFVGRKIAMRLKDFVLGMQDWWNFLPILNYLKGCLAYRQMQCIIAVVDLLKKSIAALGPNLHVVIDDISKEDPVCIGVTWHLEWNGKPFPFSKGCSFYRLTFNGQCQQISYGRDSVEPPFKPGDSVLLIIRAVTALLRKFPSLADRF